MIEHFDPGDDPSSDKGRIVMNWMQAETSDPELLLGLSILSHILLGTPASPLRKALIDSGLGEDLAGSGLETELRQVYFSTGLKGLAVKADHSLAEGEKVESLILQTLGSLARDGIDPETVAASMNTVEFQLRENNTGSFPRGLLIMLRALNTWLYDGDPFAMLAFDAPLAAIKTRLAAGERYFEHLIQTHFLDNTHRTTVVLQPQPGLNQIEEAAEKERLASARKSMSEDMLRQIFEDTRHLKQIQETPDTPEALATIPGLKLADLDRQNKLIPLDVTNLQGSQVLYHDLFTNGIVYLDLGLDLHNLPQDLLPYVPLFGRALLEMGTASEDFVRLSQRIGRTTGGIRPVTYISARRGQGQSTAWLFLRGKATTAQAPELLAILHDILLTPCLDNPERFRQMVLEEKAEKESMLVPAGHRVVNTRLRALFDEAGWVEEQMHGIDSLFLVRRLAQEMEKDWPAVLGKLEAIRQILVNRQAMLCNVTLDKINWEKFSPELDGFLGELSSTKPTPATWHPTSAHGC